ncbi:hypothetical protein GXP67_13425 [Rhodocytophaga rosea]|uniref:Uncharacterized protein n=1 Tax=Rhodocytophaga rosea TaxID=2704465 RepID=A0A6C0GHP3_9BACT|nr:hypothetical protein [Rhodocytophaga rosea]QHT67556.1 hypothetical protein GXP67_13425 [Rhodocytophaga rosea]
MMAKKIIMLLLLTGLYFTALAQSPELTAFNESRLQINKIGMLTLGSWALGNMGTAAFAIGRASGSNKYFHQMNLYWNVVNLALAGFGYYGAVSGKAGSYDLFHSIKEQYGMEKILLFNAGLDVGYMLGGLYLIERGKNNINKPDLFKGFGQSILMQGGFLFLFDLSMYLIHHSQENNLRNLIDNVSFQGNAIQIVLYF